MFRRILAETADSEHQGVVGYAITNAEALARQVMQRALAGDPKAQEMVIDRVEGKAGKAMDPKVGDGALEEQLDRAGMDALNSLIPEKTDGIADADPAA